MVYKTTALPIELRQPAFRATKTGKYTKSNAPCKTEGRENFLAVTVRPDSTCNAFARSPADFDTGTPPRRTRFAERFFGAKKAEADQSATAKTVPTNPRFI